MNIFKMIDLLSDERLLEEQAISNEYFNVLNAISLINNEKNHLFLIEMGLISLYETIKDNSDWKTYIDELGYILGHPISEDDIETLKDILIRLKKKLRPNLNLSNEIIVKKIK